MNINISSFIFDDFPYYREREKRTKQYSFEFISLIFLFRKKKKKKKEKKKFLKNFNPCVCGWKHYGRTIQLILLYQSYDDYKL